MVRNSGLSTLARLDACGSPSTSCAGYDIVREGSLGDSWECQQPWGADSAGRCKEADRRRCVHRSAHTRKGDSHLVLSKLGLATGERARHAYRVRTSMPVHTSMGVDFTILNVIDPRAELDRQTGNKRRRVSHLLWRVRGVPISARGHPRGRQGFGGSHDGIHGRRRQTS
jgi:hypothetical protein